MADYLMDLFRTVCKSLLNGGMPYWSQFQRKETTQSVYGINLLNVMGKLFSKVVQRRLQWVTKEVLLDSQCWFHSGRDGVDVVFCAQQLVEKASEHSTKIYKSCSFVEKHIILSPDRLCDWCYECTMYPQQWWRSYNSWMME